ncbi:hypothetical protein [Allohahella marinimesophila]|uniref:Uncharacterized protein n=1 Tax=Allohahella marinimesophila TaxID=1054972 RepID=A0ABP7NKQ5_9GAMM
MEPKHSRHYGPAKEAFANDAARHQQNNAANTASAAGHGNDHHGDIDHESQDILSKYDGTDTSDSKADAFAAFMLILCIAGGMLLWVSTR